MSYYWMLKLSNRMKINRPKLLCWVIFLPIIQPIILLNSMLGGIRELITMIEADSLEEWSEEHEYE